MQRGAISSSHSVKWSTFASIVAIPLHHYQSTSVTPLPHDHSRSSPSLSSGQLHEKLRISLGDQKYSRGSFFVSDKNWLLLLPIMEQPAWAAPLWSSPPGLRGLCSRAVHFACLWARPHLDGAEPFDQGPCQPPPSGERVPLLGGAPPLSSLPHVLANSRHPNPFFRGPLPQKKASGPALTLLCARGQWLP